MYTIIMAVQLIHNIKCLRLPKIRFCIEPGRSVEVTCLHAGRAQEAQLMMSDRHRRPRPVVLKPLFW